MKIRYVVTYDICDPRRLRAVLNVMKGYGDHLQYSVFRCDLSDMRLAQLRAALLEMIDVSVDQVMFIDVGPTEGRAATAIVTIGCGLRPADDGAVIV